MVFYKKYTNLSNKKNNNTTMIQFCTFYPILCNNTICIYLVYKIHLFFLYNKVYNSLLKEII